MAVLKRSPELVMAIILLASIEVSRAVHIPALFNRSSFPEDFLFGTASASYQYEGAANEGGRGPSIWDTFTHKHPEKIADHSTGDVAIDFYHRYKDDIHMIKDVGFDAFRISISWSRILPTGKISGGVNQEGIKFYNSVFNELKSKGIKPFVTLFHWDAPQALEDEYGGFLNAKIVNDFRDYANICFKEFGDRVKHWITLNEPFTLASLGYDNGMFAPGRCSSYAGNCSEGNSATEPYIVGHHLLLSHAAAVNVYKHKYQRTQKGEIGITLVSTWFKPKSRSAADRRASFTALDFMMGWFLHPITYGDYPSSMKTNAGSRLPRFSQKESKMIKGSIDFLGMNYYTSNYASVRITNNNVNHSLSTDSHVDLTTNKNGVPICQPTSLSWIFICPSGIRDLMLYLKDKYKNPYIYITENGMAEIDNGTLSVQEVLRDTLRIKYYRGHLWYLQEAIREGANVKGHFAWSFFDNFEWASGFTGRFGINYVDYKDGLRRYRKDSALWYKKFLKKETIYR